MARKRVAVIGGGAAGYFAAINCAERFDGDVIILEGGSKPLAKVEVSGGGRCNVTHNCFEPKELVKSYPRGGRELLGPFHRFHAGHTVEWFAAKGVHLKAEEDGRMFPLSDSSQTVIHCLRQVAKDLGVILRTKTSVKMLTLLDDGRFGVDTGEQEIFDAVIITTGGSRGGHKLVESLGHTVTECAPSLFTFKISDPRILGLSGVSFPSVTLALSTGDSRPFLQSGPLLITHWGVSGPAVLKLSAWAARELARTKYQATLTVNWIGNITESQCADELRGVKQRYAQKTVVGNPLFSLSRRFWESLCHYAGIEDTLRYADLSKKSIGRLSVLLTSSQLAVMGKGEFKEEFVTCGGVKLSEVDLRTMESKKVKNLFFAGEVLDVDGITGGFNFQNAWTTGFIAGHSASRASPREAPTGSTRQALE